MSYPICVTCGVQFGADADSCPICEDPRQYVPVSGQAWTTLEELRSEHRNVIRDEGSFVGHRHRASLCHRSARAARPRAVRERPLGLRHAARRRHGGGGREPRRAGRDRDLTSALLLVDGRVGRALRLPDPSARGGSPVGDARVAPDRVLVRRHPRPRRDDADPLRRALRGRHGAASRHELLAGDIVQVIPDRAWVAFMYSFPNFIPLPAAAVQEIADALESLRSSASTERGGGRSFPRTGALSSAAPWPATSMRSAGNCHEDRSQGVKVRTWLFSSL